MTGRRYRVVHCGTGVTGRLALTGIVHHPDLELVGHLVFDPAKEGRDSGELIGLGTRLGVVATRDIDVLIGLEPDFLCYFGDGFRSQDSLAVICGFLEAGVNVGTPSVIATSHAPTAPSGVMDPIREACMTGGSSYYFSGSDPGFFSPTLAVALLKTAAEVTEVRMQEIANYAFYDVERVMRDVYGFGRPKGYRTPLTSGALIRAGWSGTVNAVAERMGIELEELRPFYESDTYDKTHETLWGVVEAGTVAAVRFGLEGIYQDRPVIVVEHVTRTTLDAAPQWPKAKGGEIEKLRHEYTVLIKGDPDMDCRVALGETRAHEDASLVATAMLIVNAVPSVTEHPAGIVNEMDLPLYSTRNIVA